MLFLGLPLHDESRKELLPFIVAEVRKYFPGLIRIEPMEPKQNSEKTGPSGEVMCFFQGDPPACKAYLRDYAGYIHVYLLGRPPVILRNPYEELEDRLAG
ncbi:MAG: hypothetical protein HY220_03950 [Candidatus Sungbacteria bacterium]|uniref:Uncharacterized protein n=1 Tax=Candidatus Sungiibacteriota bacterium TaxID=2750080 RepID=A0A9D6LRS3_9BACT|nr:hypothetical protein [Candidatus Sungbacteria bacterium]